MTFGVSANARTQNKCEPAQNKHGKGGETKGNLFRKLPPDTVTRNTLGTINSEVGVRNRTFGLLVKDGEEHSRVTINLDTKQKRSCQRIVQRQIFQSTRTSDYNQV